MSADIDRIGLATVNLLANITQEIHDFSPRPLTFGGYSEIHTGIWRSKYGEMKVAIKVIRATLTAPEADELPRVLRHEIRVWKKLHHRNIHTLCGFFEGHGSAPALVSPWYENGDINCYLRSRAGAQGIDLLKLKLFADVTSGLKYLHDHHIVHGDMKGGNVLISDDGVARLCDFGLSRLLLDHSQSITHTGVKGTLRWMAPELILEEGSRQSYASDMWACGCLFIEVWGAVSPYHTKTNDHQVIFALSRGELPARPIDMPDSVWTIVEACCNFDVMRRPSPIDVVAYISLRVTMQRLELIVTGRPPIDAAGSDLLQELHASLWTVNVQQMSELYSLVDAELVAEVVRLLASWSLSNTERCALFHVGVCNWTLATFGTGKLLPVAGSELSELRVNHSLVYWACEQMSDVPTQRRPRTDPDAYKKDSRIDPSKLRPFARLLAAVDPGYADILMLRFARASVRTPMVLKEALLSVAWFPDSDRIAVGHKSGIVSILSTSSGATLHRINCHKRDVNHVALTSDGRLLASCSFDRTVRLWNVETDNAVGKPMLYRHARAVFSVSLSPDGTHIASGSVDHTIRIWSCKTGTTVVGPLCGHTDTVASVAYSPDGSRIVSASWDNTIRVWDAQTGACVLGPLSGDGYRITSVAFSPDGSRFVSGSRDMTVRIWDAASGELVGAPMEGHRDTVRHVAYSPGGERIASTSRDCTIRIWDAATHALIPQPLRGHTKPVFSAAFSPDGRKLASTSQDGTIRIWDATGAWTRWDI